MIRLIDRDEGNKSRLCKLTYSGRCLGIPLVDLLLRVLGLVFLLLLLIICIKGLLAVSWIRELLLLLLLLLVVRKLIGVKELMTWRSSLAFDGSRRCLLIQGHDKRNSVTARRWWSRFMTHAHFL